MHNIHELMKIIKEVNSDGIIRKYHSFNSGWIKIEILLMIRNNPNL